MKLVSASLLRDMIGRGRDVRLFNVLPRSHFNAKHIPGSVSVPFAEDSEADERPSARPTKVRRSSKSFADQISSHVADRSVPVIVHDKTSADDHVESER